MSELSPQPTPVQKVYNWYRDGALLVNRRYQRKLVWTLAEKQKLMDSLLQEYPIPLIILAEMQSRSPSAFEILDGLQRLHTIVSFIENAFATEDGRYFNVDEFTRAKEERESGRFTESSSGKKITRTEVAKILDYVLPISIIRNASEKVVTDVFGRINSYGHRLSDQERRQAGLLSEFSKFVRMTACEIRGDVSIETLCLHQMPEISVDLPKSRYGYSVQAEDVFWVRQGILRSTDLRDSLDEQVIADIAACIVSSGLIERSKDTLDRIYDQSKDDSAQVSASFCTYGAERLKSEIKYCIELLDKIVAAGNSKTLRSLIFENKTTNPFPTVFSTIFLALHELSFKDQLVLADATGAHKVLLNVHGRLNTRRDALTPDERRNNINLIKGLVRDFFVTGDVSKVAFGARRELDITNTLRRSAIETPRFELKQGIQRLDAARSQDEHVFSKVMETICAIANIGPNSVGAVFVGVADKLADVERIKTLDAITPIEIGSRWVVGVDREIKLMRISLERYFQLWRERIDKSELSVPLKTDILSNLDLCEYKGFHILIVTVPSQKGVSLLNGKIYTRVGDQTIEASPENILGISSRFSG